MLADDVIAYPRTTRFKEIVLPAQYPGYEALAHDVANAERFVLRRDAVLTIHSISAISMSRITPALQICRMPFPKMWVEFVYQDREDYYQMANVALNNLATASSPSRLGFYLEQTDDTGRVIDCTIVWRHLKDRNVGGESIVIGGFSIKIDTTPGVQITDEVRANFARAMANPTALEKEFSLARAFDDPIDREAALELETRISMQCATYMLPFWVFMTRHHPEEMEELRKHAVFDCLQEWRFIIGLLTVINSRNVVNYSDPITYEKLNKQRAKKDLPLMHNHREIRLALSRVQRNRTGSGEHIDVKAHTVMGHWKLRRSGLFWWSPHIRGSGPVRMRPYVIKG